MTKQNNNEFWVRDAEAKWITSKEKFFKDQLENALKKYHDPLIVGNKLSQILKNSEVEAVKMVTPRAVKKWASPKTIVRWQEIIKDDQMLVELREIGRSIANTLRPLAGNTFTQWVCQVLNLTFKNKKLPFECVTSGAVKKKLTESLVLKANTTEIG